MRGLQFLRPYAWKTLEARNTAYLRFYHLARKQELEQADALRYPRIRNDGTCMRIPAFREKYKDIEQGKVAEEEVTLRGRVQFVRRSSSKLMFVVIKSEFEQVQGMFNFRKLEGASLDGFKGITKLLNRGDIVSVTGKATRTQTGELTIEATKMPEVLTPGLVPLPVHLEDEARIQTRHMDMLVNAKTTDTLRLRSHIIKHMRDFFHDRHFLEFQTPILSSTTGGAIATPFTTTTSPPLSLRIAPELWLKRLVVGGIDKVFELGPSFRNEGIDTTHNPEFTTCEFYQAYASLSDLISLTETLIHSLSTHITTLSLSSLPAPPTFTPPFPQHEFIPTLQKALGFPLPDLSLPDAHTTLLTLLSNHNIPHDTTQPLAKLLDKLAGTYIEPLSSTQPIFITHHPVCMSPLAKSFLCPTTNQLVSARAELFIGGREMANMYEEENDPFAQREKFLAQAREKGDGDEEIDESYVRALESGLPPTGGWGCGIERLVMLFSGAARIGEVMSFGNLRNVAALGGRVG